MGSPAIFAGQRTKLLSAKGLLLKDGTTIDNDGVVNFVRNNSGAIGTTGWTEGSYTAAVRPSGTFTASSGAGSFAISTTTTTPLGYGTSSFVLTKSSGASRQGRAVETSFALPLSYRAKVLKIEADYIVNSGTFVAGSNSTDSSLIWYCAFSTNGGTTYTVAEPSSFKLLSNSTTISDKFSASIQTPSDATNMKLIAYVAESANSAWVVETVVAVSPSNYVYGTPITDWVSYTPTGNWSTGTATYTGRWRKVGDSIEVQAVVSLSGAPTAADFTVNIPAGLTIDVSKIPSASVSMVLGSAEILDSGVRVYAGTVVYAGTTSVYVNHTEAGNSGLVNATNPTTFGAADTVSLNFKVPILGWSSSVQVSDGYDGRIVSFAGSSGSGQAITAAVTNIAVTTAKDSVGAWTGSTYVVKTAGDYLVTGAVGVQAASSAAGSVYLNGTIVPQGFWTSTPAIANSSSSGATLIYDCKVGDIISVRSTVTSTISQANINIFKLAGNPVISATELVAARYTTASGQSIPNGGVFTILDFGTKSIDTNGAVTTGASWKYTAQSACVLEVSTNILFNSATWNINDAANMRLFKNGVAYANLYRFEAQATIAQFGNLNGSTIIELNAGDYVDVRVSSTRTGGSTTLINDAIFNHISIKRVK